MTYSVLTWITTDDGTEVILECDVISGDLRLSIGTPTDRKEAHVDITDLRELRDGIWDALLKVNFPRNHICDGVGYTGPDAIYPVNHGLKCKGHKDYNRKQWSVDPDTRPLPKAEPSGGYSTIVPVDPKYL